ncbi:MULTISPECIES: PhoH family protein [Pseudomonas]|jgi:PhoH-like ATPase|uniref:PhoH family protein n=1 Tax=Pseudomonas coleopterorum TaxID=1605838 RepID=A0ABR9BSP8_9PSED|nr:MULTISPECIES: PhoH family protein [Pseudomonas]KNC06884.1 ATPase [Pseudomonas sp. RIT-PI-a]KQQ57343.1 ATPase [Pseudomonas sp. Leaf129]MBD8755064.1 PhoH family protein [Pseudomonas coleopterorum]MBD8767940.1 PhoH family protein [Pseudomonas coleopterorum]MDY1049184.1 PhoH family protein [Pseudomonas coleopterorum]
MDEQGRSTSSDQPILYVLDTNVLIHDPNALLNFEEHHVAIPMTVLEELDKLKDGKQTVAAECRQAIRLIDKTLGDASPSVVESGVPIMRVNGSTKGFLSILMDKRPEPSNLLPQNLNDNIIINQLIDLHTRNPDLSVILVTKDINMRLKARACGIAAEDYSTDQLVDDVSLLSRGYHNVPGSFWDRVSKVETRQDHGRTWHRVQLSELLPSVHMNEFIIDEQGFVGWIKGIKDDELMILDLHQEPLLHQEAWGLKPRDIYQALALFALLDPDIHLVNLSGAAGSGKTILALAAAIEQTMVTKRYRRIIATRSVQGLDQEIGFLPGTEAEKMEPWLGAITDNLEALHMEDENTHGSVDYILSKVPLQFKSLNYIRGRSFQQSLILIDECQNLTPHQMKTIITRAGAGSKVICLGNLAQIDTPYLSAPSSGLTYLTERFKDFPQGVHITLQGVPRSILAEYAESHL